MPDSIPVRAASALAAPPLTAAGSAAMTDERMHDVALRVLTVLVVVTLVACVGFLTWRWLNPPTAPSESVALQPVEPRPQPVAPPAAPVAAAAPQVLLAPGHMYRCERNGRVTFSDQPCDGSARVVKLPEAK